MDKILTTQTELSVNPNAEAEHLRKILVAAENLLEAARILALLDNGTLASQAIVQLAELAWQQAYANYTVVTPLPFE